MKISLTKDIRSANRLTIIKHILNKKHISRARISEETGLNKATVSTIVKAWMSLKLVEETTTGDHEGHRAADHPHPGDSALLSGRRRPHTGRFHAGH